MDLPLELLRYRQIAELLAICGEYHLVKLAANIIDGKEGQLEQRIGQLLARRILDHLGYQIRLEGLERVRGLRRYAVVSSHASHLDWAMLLGYFPDPVRFIAKKELTAVPVIGNYLRLRGVLIDRKAGQDAKSAIRAAARDQSPFPILLFAEGTRTHDGRVQPFKPGGLRILAEEGLTLVPVRILGTFDAFSRHARAIRPGGTLTMIVGEPVDPKEGGVEWAIAEVERRVKNAAPE